MKHGIAGWLLCLLVAGWSACARPATPAKPATPAAAAAAATGSWHTEQIAGELAIARAGCTRCHAERDTAPPRFSPVVGPDLVATARFRGDDGGTAFLALHHGGDDAADLAAYLQQLAANEPPLVAAPLAAAVVGRGEQLWRELACAACHALPRLQGLAKRTDHRQLAAFLQQPAAHRPQALHDFALGGDEAAALAAFLLQQQFVEQAVVPGFAVECFELRIDSAGLPDLSGREPVARGVVAQIDATPGTRADHFALRFRATLQVPVGGRWTFITGSDDSSWLWIDDQLVVQNEALAPHRRRSGSIELAAGPHALQVVYTEAQGDQSLEVRWRSPAGHEEPIPATAAAAVGPGLQPPAPLPPPQQEAVQRGRIAARQRRCDACHAIDEPAFAELPPPAPARALAALGAGECPQQRGAAGLLAAVDLAAGAAATPAQQLVLAMERDGCLRCHSRAGHGGLPPVVQQALAEREDLGDEGRLPPDLTNIGRQLRPQWLAQVLAGERRARPYLQLRMPKLPRALAQSYAEWFAAVDAADLVDAEPPFGAAAVARGQQLASVEGKNCITCHAFAGQPALGPQGMDLAIQHERLRPGYFVDWLLRPAHYRPQTRMPALWLPGDANAAADAAALRSWSSLAAAAPKPAGLPGQQGLLLEAVDEPRWHGAFLRGLSARCIAVGSPLRTHYAYDLEHAQLAWLWRGDFLDAAGTWSGRAGKLLSPAGRDHIVLPPLHYQSEQPLAVLGWRRSDSGYPQFRLGNAELELLDASEPQWGENGSELRRRLSVQRGRLVLEVPAPTAPLRLRSPQAAAVGRHELSAGAVLELIYQW